MLMSSIGMVRKQAKMTLCRSNLHQCGLALELYTQDNEGYLPYYDWIDSTSNGGGAWYDRLAPYLDDTYRSNLYSGNNVYHCPFAATEIKNQWRTTSRFSFHFAMNAQLGALWQPGYTPSGWHDTPPRNVATVKGGTVAFSDGNLDSTGSLFYFDPMGISSTATSTNSFGAVSGPWQVEGSNYQPLASIPTNPRITLHGGTVNQVHRDGHISVVSGTYNWAQHVKDFTP